MVYKPTELVEGQQVDTGLTDELVYPCLENIENARILVFNDAYTKVRKAMANIALIDFSANLVTSDVFTAKVNGTNISVTYTDSHSNTMTLVKNAIEVLDSGLTATISGNDITVRAVDTATLTITSPLVTNGGAGTATVAVTFSSDDANRLAGISKFEDIMPDTNGDVYVKAGMPVNVKTKGRYAIRMEGTHTLGGTKYVRIEDESAYNQKRGMLKSSAGSPVVAVSFTGLTIRRVNSDNLAVVEINLP